VCFGDKMPKSCFALTVGNRVAQRLDRPDCTPELGRSLPVFHSIGNPTCLPSEWGRGQCGIGELEDRTRAVGADRAWGSQ
jgi:hypothetical protein